MEGKEESFSPLLGGEESTPHLTPTPLTVPSISFFSFVEWAGFTSY